MAKEGGDLRRDLGRLAGHEELEVDRHRVDQPLLVHQMRQRHQQESEQRYQREQRVVRDRPGQQQALVPPKVGRQAPEKR